MKYPLPNSLLPRPTAWLATVALLTGIVSLGLSQPLSAQSVAPVADGPQPVIDNADATTKKPVGPPSVVLELNDVGMNYKKQFDAANQAFHENTIPVENISRLQTKQKNFIDNPDDPRAAADYADAFSDALAAFGERLTKFLETRSALEKSYTSFVASTEAGIDAVKKERDRYAKLQAENDDVVKTVEQTLDELTSEHRPQIEKGIALPPDVDQQVVRLTNLIRQRETAKKLHTDRMKRAARNQTKLENSLAGGKQAMVEMQLQWEQAEGDLALIAEIAEGKAQELTPDPVTFPRKPVRPFVPLRDLDLFLTQGDDKDDSKSPPASEVTSLGGSELLRARLNKSAEANKPKPVEAKANIETVSGAKK